METRKQSTTTYPYLFLMIDSSDHISGKAGLTVSLKISKAGAAGITPSGAITEVDGTNLPGWYAWAGNATDRNTLGDLACHATATGADPSDFKLQIVPFDVFDLLAGIADFALGRDWTAAATSIGTVPARCTLNALRLLRNAWSTASGTLKVAKEDDNLASPAWTGTPSSTTPTNQVTGMTPN